MWTQEQLKAINQEGSNIIVSAGAGSGKTAVLTQRVIRKLKEGIDINKLLILTFTDAASQEMKSRIRSEILKTSGLDKQLDLLTSAYVCTFDSFSLSMVKKYHYLLGIDSNVSVMDENINELEKTRILDEIFESYYRGKNQDFLGLVKSFCVKDDKQLRQYILKLYKKIDLIVEKEKYFNNYFSKIMSDENIIKVNEHFETIAKEKIYNLHSIVKELSEANIECASLLDLLSDIIKGKEDVSNITKKYKITKLPPKPGDYIKSLKKEMNSLIDDIEDLHGGRTKDIRINEILCTISNQRIIIEIIKELEKRLLKFKQQTNTYTFMDIAKLAIKVVEENKEVRDELKYSLNEIMIDEYQDTSDVQEYFINLIDNNNVYMVGDIKQSIYKFRNANPTLFQSKYKSYSNNNGGCKIDLTNNFRSRKEVVEDINKMFSAIMTEELGGASYMTDHIMHAGNISYDNVAKQVNHHAEIIQFDNKDNKIDDPIIEAFIIAKDIIKKVSSKYQVLDKETKESRNVEYKDFVILISKSKDFDAYRKVFNYFQIPLSSNKNDEIVDDYDIKLLHNALKLVISNKYDSFDTKEKYAFISLLRSYLYSYSDEEIFNMFLKDNYNECELYDIISDIRTRKTVMTIKEIICELDERLGIVSKANKIGDVKKVLVHVEYLCNLAASLSDLGYYLEDYVNYLDEVFDNDLKIEYQNKLSTVSNSVQIMTIHKSKGLEFGICYFPSLYSRFNMEDLRKPFVFDNDLGIILPHVSYGKKDTILKKLYTLKEKEAILSEEVRVLYVAITRAKEKIIFIDKFSEENEDSFNSFKDFLYHYFSNSNKTIISDSEIEEYTSQNNVINKVDITKLEKKGTKLVVNEIKYEKKRDEKRSFSKSIKQIITKEVKDKLDFGTMIHEALERVDFTQKDLSIIDIDDRYKPYIEKFLNCDLLKNINDAKIYKEYEFYDQENNINGSIDLMLEYNDKIDIIDYKLKNINDEAYYKQLNGYRNYIQRKTQKKVYIYLYSIFDKRYKEL